jgi:hypothetical protein
MIYDMILTECIERHLAGRAFSLENPTNSYFWQFRKAILLMQMVGVLVIDFPQCLHGGQRPVRRRWVSNIPGMRSLEGECPGVSLTHVHLPFGAKRLNKVWKFATAEEATYPPIMCRKIAKIAAAFLEAKGVCLKIPEIQDVMVEPLSKRLCNRAAGGKFVRGNKIPPIIADFHCTDIIPCAPLLE